MEDIYKLQMQRMISFMIQEANERADDIDERAAGEAELYKSKLVLEQKLTITKLYQKNEIKLEKAYKRLIALNHLASYKQLLGLRWGYFCEVKEGVCELFKNKDTDPYLMKKLILQAVYLLLKRKVFVRVRKQDLNMLQEILSDIEKEYFKKTQQQLEIEIIWDSPLHDDLLGGAEIFTTNGKLFINNTIDERIERIFESYSPYIRERIFGRNIQRKFFN